MNIEDYADWHAAYAHFNRALFDDQLPEVVFTLHRHPRALGYAAMDRFIEREDGARLHELGMNPDEFLNRPDLDTLSTLVHEMVHVWQFCFGRCSRGYHNREWADRMELAGLMPSDTGKLGGRRTGKRVSHWIIPGGPFDLAAAELLEGGWTVRRGLLRREGGKRDPSKTPFSCPTCGQTVWGKPTSRVDCRDCALPMAAAQPPPGGLPVPLD